MKNLKWFDKWSLALVVILIPCLTSCDNSDTEPATGQESIGQELELAGQTEPATGQESIGQELELAGQWAVTEIQGYSDASGNPLSIDGSVSTFTFNADGTYQWFLHAQPSYNLEGAGTYSLNGATLTVTGVIADTLFSETSGNEYAISLTLGADTFSFRDEDRDRWSYAKVQ